MLLKEVTVSIVHLLRPVYISPSLHIVQCSDHYVQAGVEGVVVDALSSRAHFV